MDRDRWRLVTDSIIMRCEVTAVDTAWAECVVEECALEGSEVVDSTGEVDSMVAVADTGNSF